MNGPSSGIQSDYGGRAKALSGPVLCLDRIQPTPEEDMHRVMTIHSWDADPFVMAYDRKDEYQRKFQRG